MYVCLIIKLIDIECYSYVAQTRDRICHRPWHTVGPIRSVIRSVIRRVNRVIRRVIRQGVRMSYEILSYVMSEGPLAQRDDAAYSRWVCEA